jgi:hypothetical protein
MDNFNLINNISTYLGRSHAASLPAKWVTSANVAGCAAGAPEAGTGWRHGAYSDIIQKHAVLCFPGTSASRSHGRLILDLSFPAPDGGENAPETSTPSANTFAYRVRYGNDCLIPVDFVELRLEPKRP